MRETPTVEEWLTYLPPDLQMITRELIAVVRKNVRGRRNSFITTRLDIPSTIPCLTGYATAPAEERLCEFGFFFGEDLCAGQ